MSVKAVTFRGKPYWMIRVRRDGDSFRREMRLDRSRYLKRDALEAEQQIIREYEATKGGPRPTNQTVTAAEVMQPPAPPRPTESARQAPGFDEFSERYLALQDPNRSDYRNKVNYVRRHLQPFFGEVTIDQIDRMMIDALKVRLRNGTGEVANSRQTRQRKWKPVSSRRKGGPLSIKTVNNILGALRAVLNLACEYQLIPACPRIKFDKADKADPKYLDRDEADRFLEAVPAEWMLFVLVMIETGLREGELLELRRQDVMLDAARPFIRVGRSVRTRAGGRRDVKSTKGRRPRSVPLTRGLAEALQQHLAARRKDALVFPDENGGHLSQWRVYRMIVAAGKAAGLDKHVHPHMLRHTFASHAAMTGVPLAVVQRWLGHSSVQTTEIYAHLAPDTGAELIERVSRGRCAKITTYLTTYLRRT